jgi:multisubunit Na+/H+ antiporter MnhC subunit
MTTQAMVTALIVTAIGINLGLTCMLIAAVCNLWAVLKVVHPSVLETSDPVLSD